jgi:SOS response regulatory protein OraA/RecX
VWMVHSGTLKRLGLRPGMFLDVQEYENEISQSEAAEAREFALRSLTARGRTAGELTGILIRKGFTGEQAARTVSWIDEKGLIEEDILLEDTVESLMKSKGIHQVRQILNRRGFSKSEADRVLKEKAEEPEHYESVMTLARKKKRELQARYPEAWAQRLGSWLYGKGHDGDMIRRILGELKAPDNPFED